jgi:hypothetical protein
MVIENRTIATTIGRTMQRIFIRLIRFFPFGIISFFIGKYPEQPENKKFVSLKLQFNSLAKNIKSV